MSSKPDVSRTDWVAIDFTKDQLHKLAKTYATSSALGANVGALGSMKRAEVLKIDHPDYDFLQQAWHYGFTSINLMPLFEQALTIPVEVDLDLSDELEALIKRLGFYPHQRKQVRKSLEVAFHAFLALHLVSGGDTTWPPTFDSFNHKTLATAVSVLGARPLMHSLMHPPPSFIEGMAGILKKNPYLPSGADLATDMQDVRIRGESIHQTFVEKALSTAVQIQHTTASQTWLSMESQRYATHRSQWEQLGGMTRI